MRSGIALALLVVTVGALCSAPTQRALADVQVQLELPQPGDPDVQQVRATPQGAQATRDWVFSATPAKFTMIPLDDLSVPVKIAGTEHVLSSAAKGVIKFQDGKVRSVTRTKLDIVQTPNIATRAIRPTLIVSIPGADLIALHGLDAWQSELSQRLSPLINTMQYKHFMVDWESTRPLQTQAADVADAIKEFLREKQLSWDVVLIGHSRGGIFAHEILKRLAGYSKISKLHAMLLDPTSATTFGDTYPTSKPSGTYGYLKFDGQVFSYAGSVGTRSDETIIGYDNYGQNNFLANLYGDYTNPQQSHIQYPNLWVESAGPDGFSTAWQNVLALKDNAGGAFPVDSESGDDVLVVRQEVVGSDLDASCSTRSCTFEGFVTIGYNTVSLTGLVGVDGLDVAVSTAFAGASAVIRRDQIALTQSDIFTTQSARVDTSGITVTATIANGYGVVSSELGITHASVNVGIGGVNLPVITVGPLDAVIPGASLAKSAWNAFKHLF